MSEISHKTLRATIETELDLKVKFTSVEQAYDLLALLKALLPKKEKLAVEAAEDSVPMAAAKADKAAKPKKVKKATTVTADEAELLAPADADVAGGDVPTLGATDEFRGNKYRLQALNPALCVARKIDEANPIVGTRPGDEGAKGKVFPETQCSKKPIAGGLMCATCAKKETEYLADTEKVPKGWYGRLDEPLFHKAYVVGCDWFLTKYPSGIEGAAAAAAPTKSKKDKAPKAAAPAEEAAPAPPKKAKKAPKAEPEEAAEAAEEVVEAPAPAKKSKKDKAPKAAPAAEAAEEEVEEAPAPPAKKPEAAPKPSKKATVASSGAAKEAEWVTFFADGTLLIRHSKTGNVYQCDQSKHRLEDMVQRDKFEGKWRGGRLDPYGEEDED
jgi:hypothetical protein